MLVDVLQLRTYLTALKLSYLGASDCTTAMSSWQSRSICTIERDLLLTSRYNLHDSESHYSNRRLHIAGEQEPRAIQHAWCTTSDARSDSGRSKLQGRPVKHAFCIQERPFRLCFGRRRVPTEQLQKIVDVALTDVL